MVLAGPGWDEGGRRALALSSREANVADVGGAQRVGAVHLNFMNIACTVFSEGQGWRTLEEMLEALAKGKDIGYRRPGESPAT